MTAIIWISIILGGAAILIGVGLLVRAQMQSRPKRATRTELTDSSGARIPFREDAEQDAQWPRTEAAEGFGEPFAPEEIAKWSDDEVENLLDTDQPWPRRVVTPNGEMTLTAPPFRLKRSIMNWRERAYARAITARMPGGYVLCPQLRLDSLLVPTPPLNDSADDFRNWRRRVRVRAIDFVVCRLPDWSPVLAIEINRGETRADQENTQHDRMTEETLIEVGLPLIRCSGSPEKDWPMIEPYLTEDDAEGEQQSWGNVGA